MRAFVKSEKFQRSAAGLIESRDSAVKSFSCSYSYSSSIGEGFSRTRRRTSTSTIRRHALSPLSITPERSGAIAAESWSWFHAWAGGLILGCFQDETDGDRAGPLAHWRVPAAGSTPNAKLQTPNAKGKRSGLDHVERKCLEFGGWSLEFGRAQRP